MDKETQILEVRHNYNPGEVVEKEKTETTHLDSYGIERRNDEKQYPDQMKFHLASVIQNEKFHPFFRITQEEAIRILAVCNFFKMSDIGIQKEIPSAEDLRLYSTALNRYSSCPPSSPHFVIPEEDGTFIFCMDHTREKIAIKRDGRYFLLRKLEKIDDSINQRIQKINTIGYFPKIEIYTKSGENYIAREFIPELGLLEKGSDVSDFVEQCKSINFGPDTNVTNFVRYKDRIFYIDQDYIDFVIEPEKHQYDENKNHVKRDIW